MATPPGVGRSSGQGMPAPPGGGANEQAAVPMGGWSQVNGVATFIVHNLTGDPGHPLSRVQKSFNFFILADVVVNQFVGTVFEAENGWGEQGGRPAGSRKGRLKWTGGGLPLL